MTDYKKGDLVKVLVNDNRNLEYILAMVVADANKDNSVVFVKIKEEDKLKWFPLRKEKHFWIVRSFLKAIQPVEALVMMQDENLMRGLNEGS